ncbi:RES family NAD+ phosphorylase [Legionella pneumophila]|uniref:RES family NAD+ phosphorylase n=2 Tax=Legionella pneumophila TaxID=446 RepID=UPI0038D2176D
MSKQKFGAAPKIQFNYSNPGDDFSSFSEPLKKDMKMIESAIGLRFFYYGPRLWMIGENEPLKALQRKKTRKKIIERIIKEYPVETLDINRALYRLRKNPSNEKLPSEYDSPPESVLQNGRLESVTLPIMYCSQEIETCIHECRSTVADDLYLAILNPTKDLHVLNLAKIIQDDSTEFESLDIGVHMLFMAAEHSYELSREIAVGIKNAGFDGLIYPSYFSSLQTGAQPLETVIGLSIRRFSRLKESLEAEIKPNIALFGRPLEEGKVKINCISKVVLKKVTYDFDLGPVETAETHHR